MNNFKLNIFFILLIHANSIFALEQEADPLNSPSWKLMHEVMLNSEPVIFDNRVVVNTPNFAEDALNVPVSINANEISNIQEIVVFADLNPIQRVLDFKPINSNASISFRIKVEQSTPVRAAVKTSDGVWYVGGKWLDAAGGGCTVSSNGMAAGTWPLTLMNVSSRVWENDTEDRLRFRVMHPMDTGLAPGVPEFYLQTVNIIDQNGKQVANLQTYQPLSENPVFTIDVKKDVELPLVVQGIDNNGNKLNASINH